MPRETTATAFENSRSTKNSSRSWSQKESPSGPKSFERSRVQKVVGLPPKVTGTRIVIEVEIDGDKETAREVLVEMLESLTERFDLLSCSGKVGRASE